MIKKYSLVFLAIFCFVLSGFGQTIAYYDDGRNFTSGSSDTNLSGATVSIVGLNDGSDYTCSGLALTTDRWNNGNTVDTNEYLQYSITINLGYEANFNGISFQSDKSSTGPVNWAIRSSIDGYSSNLAVGTHNDSCSFKSGSFSLTNVSGLVTFRIYGYNATSTGNVRIGDFTLNGIVSLTCTPPADPAGTISGTTPACNSTTLTYTGATIPGTVDYWQTTATGTSTANNATGTFNAVTTGTYYVRTFLTATSCWSAGTESYAVVINATPTISAQPANAARVIPNTATFSITATGIPTPTYQWQVSTNGGTTWNNVTGGSGATTASYTTGATSAPMSNNQYRCVATNSCGSTTSNAATLSLSNSSPNNARNLDACYTDTTVDLSWDAPTGTAPDGYVVFAIAGGTTPTGTKGDANSYTANSDFVAAATVTPTSLGKVVYKGTTRNVLVTSLTENANYSFSVYAYIGESLTGWSTGSAGSRDTNGLAQGDVRNLAATPLTNQVTLNWLNPLPTSCWDEILIVANQGAVAFTPTGDGSAYTANAVYAGANQVVYKGSANSVAVTGLTNGLNYCFRAYIRRGTTWTAGVEVCATPTLTYCASVGNTTYRTGIRRVVFNTIDNATPIEYNDYSDFTATESTNVNLGEGYDLSVHVNTDGPFTLYTRVWIDWNQDGDFNGSGEEYDLGDAYDAPDAATTNSPLNVEVPITAVLGTTRMRVSTRFGSYSTSCLKPFDGEVEDYTIVVQQPANAEINIKGNAISIPSGFNAPYGLNNTLFAATDLGSSSIAKTYTIQNIGLANLTLTGTPRVEITGLNPGDFDVNMQPSTATIGSYATTDFQITFTPLADGERRATVSIANSDTTGGENPYTFEILGNGQCVTTITSTLFPMEGPVGTEITVTSGSNLTGAIASLNGVALTVLSSSTSELILQLPSGVTDGNLVVTLITGCSSTNSFDVIDTSINGCETGTSSTTPSNLFISEVTDATSGSSSYVEIFNGTGAPVNLANYDLKIYNNGNASASNTLALTGTLANNAVHLVSIGTTSCSLNNLTVSPNQVFPGVGGINFDTNKADAIILEKTSGSLQGEKDAFGVKGSGSWANGLSFGSDGVNFRRKNDAPVLPTTTFDLTHWDIIDWTSCADSDYVNVGFYDFSLGIPPTITLQPIIPTSNCDLTASFTVAATEGVPAGLALAYQWYYLAPMQTTWTAVTNGATYAGATSATLDVLNTLNTIDYQFYCQVRENTATCYTASEAVKLHVTRTIWDGTDWTNSTPPDEFTIAVIDGAYDTFLNGDFDACQLIINSGAGRILNVDNSGYVRVVNNVINNGTITVQTHGAFVQDGVGTNAGTFTNNGSASVIKYTELLYNWYQYTYWSSPITNQAFNSVTPNTPNSRRFYFETANYLDQHTDGTMNGVPDDIDDDGNDWQNASGNIMELGRGYAATSSPSGLYPGTDQALFDGAFFTGDIVKPILTNGFAGDNDWNLIGNPYASAIAFNDLYTENSTLIDGAAYLWSQASPPLDTNPGNQLLNFNQADYAIITVGSGNTAGGSTTIPASGNFIPSGQGFFIKALNSGDLRFTNAMRRADNTSNNQFFRSSDSDEDTSSEPANRLWINLISDNGVFNQILVAYVAGATNGEDSWSYDAPRNLSSGLAAVIYTSIEGTNSKYAIQGKTTNSLSLSEIIPIGFKTSITEATIYSLSIAQLEGDFMTGNTVYLKDKLLNVIHDLSANDYSFTSETGEFNDRFEIVFRESFLSINEEELSANNITIIELQNGEVQFKVPHAYQIKTVEIIDLLGRTVYRLKGDSATETYNLSNLSQATYIAKITLSNGQVISKKAVKRK